MAKQNDAELAAAVADSKALYERNSVLEALVPRLEEVAASRDASLEETLLRADCAESTLFDTSRQLTDQKVPTVSARPRGIVIALNIITYCLLLRISYNKIICLRLRPRHRRRLVTITCQLQ